MSVLLRIDENSLGSFNSLNVSSFLYSFSSPINLVSFWKFSDDAFTFLNNVDILFPFLLHTQLCQGFRPFFSWEKFISNFFL
jgi:hypothetical protein